MKYDNVATTLPLLIRLKRTMTAKDLTMEAILKIFK